MYYSRQIYIYYIYVYLNNRMNSQQWNQQLQYQQSRLGEGGIPHPRSVALSGRDDFMGGGMQQQHKSFY